LFNIELFQIKEHHYTETVNIKEIKTTDKHPSTDT